jgi:hypothetical protein
MQPLKQLTPAEVVPPKWTAFCAQAMKHGCSIEEARKIYKEETSRPCWMNADYMVAVKEMDGGFTHLSIRRIDRKPCRDWRHFQQIKNQLCGAEREGVELYPAESRVVDCANQFHLWVLPVGLRVPLGYDSGMRAFDHGVEGFPFKQRGEGE